MAQSHSDKLGDDLRVARSLRCLDPQQPDERRLVLLFVDHDVEDAEPLAACKVDLVAQMDHLGVGCLARFRAVLEVYPVPEHVSSDPGPVGVASLARPIGH
jgi:hypothetical protein